MKKTEQIPHAAKAAPSGWEQIPGLHLEVHGGVTLAVLAEHIVVTRQDGIENDTHQRGNGQAGEADVDAAHLEGNGARGREVDAQGQRP